MNMENLNVAELVERLGADEESVRKMAVFKLQNAIGDPSFADVFIQEGGLPKLRFLALHSTGNTLAYCLTSLSRLLELDKGWDHVTDDLIKRVSACLPACVTTASFPSPLTKVTDRLLSWWSRNHS